MRELSHGLSRQVSPRYVWNKAVCKIRLAKKPVNVTGVAFGSVDITVERRNHILTQALINQLALFFKLLFVFWFVTAVILL